MGSQEIWTKDTHGLQELGRAQLVILETEADLVLVLTQMGVDTRMKLGSSIPYHGNQFL